jgi:hypothetical protein
MSIFNIFRQPPPPPPPFYKTRPVATAGLIFTLFATLVIGPTQYIARGMDAKIEKNATNIESIQKEKATNETVKDTLLELKEQRKEQAVANKEQNRSIQTNQIAIEKILIRQEIIKAPSGFGIKTEGKADSPKTERNVLVKAKPKAVLTPEQFERYLSMAPDIRVKYKNYLEQTGKDVSGLPD